MKTRFLSALFLGCAPAAFAISLYDTAPPVGMLQSHAIRYSAHATVGYDDNLNSSPTNQDDGFFTSLGVGASYSDQESATRISYNANLGVRVYDKSAEGSSRELFSDCSLSASLSHSFSAGSVYTTSLSVSFTPDLNLADSISAAYTQGEAFRWTWSNAYSRSIDSRWSWTASASYSGSVYTSNAYQSDDRQYLTGGLTLSYRASMLTTYGISSTFTHDFRRDGENSENVYLNLSVSHSLTPISSVYATAGTQLKCVASRTDLYPNLRVGYRRVISEGMNANLYLSYDNENVSTGRNASSMYLSDQTIRAGASLDYRMTHKVSFFVDASILSNEYSKHTGGAQDKSERTWVLSTGMRYMFTKNLTGLINYQFTSSDKQWGDYHRNKVSTGVSYSF